MNLVGFSTNTSLEWFMTTYTCLSLLIHNITVYNIIVSTLFSLESTSTCILGAGSIFLFVLSLILLAVAYGKTDKEHNNLYTLSMNLQHVWVNSLYKCQFQLYKLYATRIKKEIIEFTLLETTQILRMSCSSVLFIGLFARLHKQFNHLLQ